MPLLQVRGASFFLPSPYAMKRGGGEGKRQGVVVFRGEMGRPAAFNGFVCLVGEAWNLYMGKEGGQGREAEQVGSRGKAYHVIGDLKSINYFGQWK